MGDKFELLARLGYAARGAVYGILGVIALLGAIAGGGSGQGPKEALSSLLGQPFGHVMLAVVAIGLLGHVLWRLAQAVLNADHQDHDAKGYVIRAGNLASGLANLSLAVAAGSLAIASASGSSDGEQGISAWLMQQPFGRYLVGAVGLALIGAGIIQAWRGVSKKYQERIQLPHGGRGALHVICATGLSARGVLLAISGGFFVFAAFTVHPEEAGGLAEGLDWVRQLPFGLYLYGLAAIGLIAFALYSVIEARYRRVDAPDVPGVKQAASKVESLSSGA